jgi:hypothetical protein
LQKILTRVIGDKEVETGTVAPRFRDGKSVFNETNDFQELSTVK